MILLAALLAAAPADSLVVSAAWLEQHLTDPHLVVVETGMADDGYRAGHVPGARFVSAMRFHIQQMPGPYPSASSIVAAIEGLGITNEDRVVLVGDPMSAAITFVAFDYVGHGRRTAVLDGGTAAWRAVGGQLTRELPSVKPSHYRPNVRDDLIVDAAWVAAHRDSARVRLLDARSEEEYLGTSTSEGLPRYGHIPGARHLDWMATLDSSDVAKGRDGDGSQSGIRFKSVAEQSALFRQQGAEPGQLVVTYCTMGMRASELYLIARRLGYDARIYPGSMVDWSRRPELPIATGAAR